MGKQLITTNITSTAQMPIRKMTLDHLQEAQQEDMRALARHVGTDDAGGTPGTVAKDILYGLQATIVGSAFSCNRGAVYTGGEIYLVNASSFTIGGGQYPIFVLDTSYASGDPTEFTDSNSHNIHRIRTLRVISGTTGTTGYAGTFSDYTNKNLPAIVAATNNVNVPTGVTKSYKNKFGQVTLQGFLQMNGSFGLSDTLCTLPVGHRPSSNLLLTTIAFKPAGLVYGTVFLEVSASTGEIEYFLDPDALISNGTIVYMNNISFYTI